MTDREKIELRKGLFGSLQKDGLHKYSVRIDLWRLSKMKDIAINALKSMPELEETDDLDDERYEDDRQAVKDLIEYLSLTDDVLREYRKAQIANGQYND